MHGLEQEYYNRINFVYLDNDDPATKPMRAALGSGGQPVFYLLDAEGNTIKKWTGITQAASFREAFDLHLAGEAVP